MSAAIPAAPFGAAPATDQKADPSARFDAAAWVAAIRPTLFATSVLDVANALVTFLDGHGLAVASWKALRKRSGYSLTTTRRAIRLLEAEGLLRRELRHDHHGACIENCFVLVMEVRT